MPRWFSSNAPWPEGFGKRYSNLVTRTRAFILSVLLLLSIPAIIVNSILVFNTNGALLNMGPIALGMVLLCLYLVHRGASPALIGFLYGLAMEALFLQGYLRIGSNVALLWLCMVPSIIVFSSGAFTGSLMFIPIIVLLPAFAVLSSVWPDRFATPLFMTQRYLPSDIVSFVAFVVVLYILGLLLNGLAIRLHAAYLDERKQTLAEIERRKQKERDLAAAVNMLGALFKTLPVPVFVKDAQLRYTHCNLAFLEFFNIEAERVIGQTIDVLYEDEDDRLVHQEADRRLLEEGTTQRYSVRVQIRDLPGEHECLFIKTPLRDADGRIRGFTGVIFDETARKADERRLMVLLESRRSALALLAHDLRNPIGSFLQLVGSLRQDDCLDPAEYREVLGELERSLGSLWGLLEELLDWVKTDEALSEFRPEPVRLLELLRSEYELAAGRASLKSITLSLDCPVDLTLEADRRMLSAIVRNLLSNALKFTPSGGVVCVRASREAEAEIVQLAISDTGIGMKADYVANLLSDLPPRSRHGTAGEPGTGLGLPLCRRLIERHRGFLDISSREGAGTTFTVNLPIAQGAPAGS